MLDALSAAGDSVHLSRPAAARARQRQKCHRWLKTVLLVSAVAVARTAGAGAGHPSAQTDSVPKEAEPAYAAEQEPPPRGYLPDGSLVSERIARGRELFAKGRYTEAAAILIEVHAVDAQPIHLFNISQSYRRAGLLDEATARYNQFLSVAPQHAHAAEARSYLREIEVLRVERQRADQRARELAATRSALRTEQERLEVLRRQRPLHKRAWFWVVLGGTLTAAALAGAVGGVLASQKPKLPETDTGFVDFAF